MSSLNVSKPLQIKKWWNAYINFGASYIDNQADYGDGAIVDVQAYTYNMFQSHTFTLPKGFKFELSGFMNGPGVWGGVFRYDANYQLNVGLQKKLLKYALKVRASYNNLTNRKMFFGSSSFNGLESTGNGRSDNRFFSLSPVIILGIKISIRENEKQELKVSLEELARNNLKALFTVQLLEKRF